MICWNSPIKIWTAFCSLRAAEDGGLTARIGIDVIDEQWMALGDISGGHLDLLERQLHILQRVIAPPTTTRRRGFCLFRTRQSTTTSRRVTR